MIGEAVARIPESTRMRYPQIKWKSIKGFRDIAVHVYYELDWPLVWETAKNQVPELAEQIAQIIKNDFPLLDEAGDRG